MSRNYRHMLMYEEEILVLKESGITEREIAEKLGFTNKQIHNFVTRHNAKLRKIAAGIALNNHQRTML